jgi:pimeloyl-ACP methyl ester carboxylesterase
MPQPLYEYGGSGAVIHMALANGFPPQTYQPLLQPLTARYRVVSLPPRPLWTDPPPPQSIRSWRSLGDDLLAGMRLYDLTSVIAIGHSFGGIASIVAAAQEPERFRGLVLLDPTIFTPDKLRLIGLLRRLGFSARMPLAQKALRRRARFASVDDAYTYWRGKRLFYDWSDEAVRLYAEGLTRPAADGSGLELAWSPEWEAHYYTTLMTETWRYLRKLPPTLPLLTVRGLLSDTFLADAAARLRALLPHMEYVEIVNHGHLFPQAAPDETRAAIERWLEKHRL